MSDLPISDHQPGDPSPDAAVSDGRCPYYLRCSATGTLEAHGVIRAIEDLYLRAHSMHQDLNNQRHDVNVVILRNIRKLWDRLEQLDQTVHLQTDHITELREKTVRQDTQIQDQSRRLAATKTIDRTGLRRSPRITPDMAQKVFDDFMGFKSAPPVTARVSSSRRRKTSK